MTARIHVSTRNDLSGTPFQVYVLDIESGREIWAQLDPDFKSVGDATAALRNVADALDAAWKRAGGE